MDNFNILLVEMSVIGGFNNFETMSLDDFIEDEKNIGNTIRVNVKGKSKFDNIFNSFVSEALEAGDAEVNPVDMDALIHQKLEKPSKGVDIAKRPDKLIHKSNILDEKGNILDSKILMQKIMQRPARIIGQNTKIAKTGFGHQIVYDLTLPSYMGLFVDESSGEFKIVKTCPSAGECSKFCYAAKGGYVMFPNSSLLASRVVNYLMNDPEGFKAQLLSELQKAQNYAKKKKSTVTLRWHDSGDFLSEKYLNLAFDIARESPEVLHYAYTKQVPLIKRLETQKPDNFVFNFSFGGTHDALINPLVDKHARVVPYDLFKDLPHTKTSDRIEFTPTAINMLKTRTANAYGVDKKSVITYDELADTPVKPNKKWNVLVWKGHGDDAASRKDVLGTYLLFH